MLIHIDSPWYLRTEELAPQPDWSTLFGNDRPLALEIGCGVGDFIARTAADHPDWNFIALDYYNKGCLKTCRRVEKQGLSNVRVLRVEAREFIAERLAPGSLHAVYINCPDPWPKKRHRKRRLVNRTFVEFLRTYLAPGGELYFATDFDDYGTDVARLLPEIHGLTNILAPDAYRHALEGYHLSKYMCKFMEQGKKIYFVHYRKLAA
jgi:tRNA (guanine-N7-)-methyltransferase